MYNYSNAIFEYSEFFKFIDSSIMNGVPFERYSVSNYGRVYDNYLKEFPTIGCNEDGYLFVSLYINGQTIQFPIHELVGHYFVARYYSHRILRHIDGNKKNNFFMNLEWVYNGYQWIFINSTLCYDIIYIYWSLYCTYPLHMANLNTNSIICIYARYCSYSMFRFIRRLDMRIRRRSYPQFRLYNKFYSL